MLWSLADALFLAGRVAGQTCVGGTGMTQTGENNFVIDTFTTDTLLFSYAINQCTGVSLTDSSAFYKYTCTQDSDDKWWVTKTSYAASDCSGTATVKATWDDSKTVAGEAGYFKCDGMNNYASIQISIDSQCAGYTTVYGGLGACSSNPTVLDTKFYCDSSSAAVQLYYNPTVINSTYSMCDDSHLYCNKWSFTKTCSLSAQLFGQLVYGTMGSCATSEPGNEMDSSASSQFTLMGIAITLIVGLFH
jgi:hypothetical protein